jgi:DNA-binding NarL/FixJ family response regulator
MLTTYENASYLARAVAGGASGYLLKGIKRAELLEALRKVANGESLLSHKELQHALQNVPRASEASPQSLSERETEVLKLLSQGLSNREIGAQLFVSENTIKTHVVNIISKLGVSDRVQAAVWAVRNGLV